MALIVTWLAVSNFVNVWLRLLIGGPPHTGWLSCLCYFIARAQLRDLVFGLVPAGKRACKRVSHATGDWDAVSTARPAVQGVLFQTP